MFPAIYIEKQIQEHPRVVEMCQRYADTPKILCDNYGEVFNKRAQNFRLQKARPSLILAKKFKNFLLPTPAKYGIGGEQNFYFSHLLNCPFDCRYCFLQGMYASAHYVLFINYEDFMEAIRHKIAQMHKTLYFFSGYDSDSLALESITHFAKSFLPFFQQMPQAFFELRSKSIHLRALLEHSPLENVIVAFSLTPEPIAQALEHGAPPLEKRLEAMKKIQERGWPLGIRLDPLIYCQNYQTLYAGLIERVFSLIDATKIHSVTMGPFRLPRALFKNMVKLYPEEQLFAHSLQEKNALVSYLPDREKELLDYCKGQLLKYIHPNQLFEHA